MASESSLKKDVAQLIRKRGGWARSVPSGFHTSGMGDLIGCYRGVCLVWEMKLPGKERTLTPIQEATLKQAKEAGALARMITSVEQARRLLDRIDQLRDTS